MNTYGLYFFSLALQGIISPLLAIWLWVKAGQQPGMKALALFCVGIGLWATGQLAINLGDARTSELGKMLVNTGPVNAVFFLHFVLRFLGRLQPARIIAWYAVALLVVLGITVFDMGNLLPWLEFQRYYVFPVWGWIPGIFVSGLSTWAYLLLLMAWPAAAPKKRGQILAVCLAGVWGSASTLMFLNASFGIPIFPYSVILLPFYAVLLVLGILRYDMMAVNLWANRFLAWLALSLLTVAIAGLVLSLVAQTGFSPLAALPLWQLWLLGTGMLLIMLMLERPMRSFMEKLIFPGAHLEAAVLSNWRVQLEAAASWQELEATASDLLETHLRQPMPVFLSRDGAPGSSAAEQTCVICYRQQAQAAQAEWHYELRHWEGATPSVQRVGAVFGALLAAAAGRLDQLLRYADQEKQRLQQAHLTELGGLAATVAHELRNPLNIISMAAISCPAEVRNDIREQIERADHLIQDLLSYSGEVRLNCQPVDVAELIDNIVAQLRPPAMANGVQISSEIEQNLHGNIDRMRTEQILNNLLNNALAMLRGRPDARIHIEAATHKQMLRLRICDNGPGIPTEQITDLFQAFKSRRPGGTGLGLAIVRRLVEAHGGSIALVSNSGWNCCFELYLPKSP
ncbi:sensor histidine kinase [Undibacterium umbellatum]|uniref:histidine kinase n=1 Tax=Undibacterium umbellatum TaxID=2762300 RepID=A0ABR6ZGE7_9BURK|nr:sensor histidine kinase [Undibacterium umbellatum]MBC3910426.1 GHKL domain-containing protein [Undibacterium umbellatum]